MKILNAIAIFLLVWFAIKLYNMFRANAGSAEKEDPNIQVKKKQGKNGTMRKDPDLSDAEYIDFEEVKD
jgi:hypothetical protein